MFRDQIERLHQQIQHKEARLALVHPKSFPREVTFLLQFMHDNALIRGIVEQLVLSYPGLNIDSSTEFQNVLVYGDSEKEHAAISYLMLRRWSESENKVTWWFDALRYGKAQDNKVAQENMISVFIAPLCAYIIDCLDDNRMVLAMLHRYKHRCEWFHRDRLLNSVQEDSRRGEKKLLFDLYEYLFDKGINITIEPWSASGEADLVGQQDTNDPLIADTKIFDPGRDKSVLYLINGFNQVYTYTRDFNIAFGYMVIFKTCEEDIKFDLSGLDMSVPYVHHNGKTIFLIVIDVHQYEKTASKRGQARCYVIAESDLILEIQNNSAEADNSSDVIDQKSDCEN